MFHVHLGKKTNELKRESGFDKIKEKMDIFLLQKTGFHRVLFMGMMNKIPISSKEPEGSPDTPCSSVQVRKRLGTLKSIQMTKKENGMNWQSKLRTCILFKSIQFLKEMLIWAYARTEEVQTCRQVEAINTVILT